jgi:hypothetical protein
MSTARGRAVATIERASDVANKTLIVTPAQVRAAKLIMKIDARRGRESTRAVRAIANATPLRGRAQASGASS